jgi:hypothetical protein
MKQQKLNFYEEYLDIITNIIKQYLLKWEFLMQKKEYKNQWHEHLS